ncbi:unnamed protein product [Peronospora destructor]|uniref:Uncharacterized protein n=1 Tax=Peronospora destructor TaxID=86335 RepID=A0AAV0V236_9STRA|nr:unnamed protein product [Peronospora destructor]
MELDQAGSRFGVAVLPIPRLLGAMTCVSRGNNRLVLLTSAEDVREICASTRKCINHGPSELVCTRAARGSIRGRVRLGEQEDNKTTVVPANEGSRGLARHGLGHGQVETYAFAVELHGLCATYNVKLKEEVVVVFRDGSFVAYDED